MHEGDVLVLQHLGAGTDDAVHPAGPYAGQVVTDQQERRVVGEQGSGDRQGGARRET
jgi:hypothetical protein